MSSPIERLEAGDAAWAAGDAARTAGPFLAVIDEFERATGFHATVKFGLREYEIVREGARI